MPVALVMLALLALAFAAVSPAQADPARAKALLAEKNSAVSKVQNEHLMELQSLGQLAVVRDYFLLPAKDRPSHIDAVQKALAGRQMGSELCLIDSRGAEHLRAVRGRLAPSSELAQDEGEAPFFIESMRLTAGKTYISRPYLSPDVEEWVIGYVVPVVPGQAILHFEHPLRELQAVATQGAAPPNNFILLLDPRGYIVADSRQPVSLGMVGNDSEPKDYFRTIASAVPDDLAAALKLGGRKEMRTTMDGRNWDVAWREAAGLLVVAFDAN